MFVREATFTAEHVNIVICILSHVIQLSLQSMEGRVANNHSNCNTCYSYKYLCQSIFH